MNMKKSLIATALIGFLTATTASANDDNAELRKVIAEQQKVLKALEARLDETEQRLESTAEQVESNSSDSLFARTTIGGYGELHYNNYDYDDKDDKKEIDFHRFVLFFGHEFTDKIRFFSEFELEHSLSTSGEDNEGEVELEQAYVEYDFNDALTGKVGVFLIPVGIINETHEPPTFYGVERNQVEKNIIPATWWEAGLAVNVKAAPGLSIDAALTSGLEVDTEGSKAFNIRSGRQKVSKATAEDLAFTSRIKYTAINGLELAATVQYQQDITQGKGADTADAILLSTHAIYNIENFSVRALYSSWDISGDEAEAVGRDEQNGWYVEPSYKFTENLGAFVRYSEYDINAGDSADTKEKQTSVGINYYLHENVVLKADWEGNTGKTEMDGFNLGFGYQF